MPAENSSKITKERGSESSEEAPSEPPLDRSFCRTRPEGRKSKGEDMDTGGNHSSNFGGLASFGKLAWSAGVGIAAGIAAAMTLTWNFRGFIEQASKEHRDETHELQKETHKLQIELIDKIEVSNRQLADDIGKQMDQRFEEARRSAAAEHKLIIESLARINQGSQAGP